MNTPLVRATEPPYDEHTHSMLQKWMPPGAAQKPLELFRTLTKSPNLMEAMLPLGRYFLGSKSPFSLRKRELLILRTCYNSNCEYEWGVHVAGFAKIAKISIADIKELSSRQINPTYWSGEEYALLCAADTLQRQNYITGAIKIQLQQYYNDETILALLAIVGWYGIIANIANTSCSANEPWAPPFPA